MDTAGFVFTLDIQVWNGLCWEMKEEDLESLGENLSEVWFGLVFNNAGIGPTRPGSTPRGSVCWTGRLEYIIHVGAGVGFE